MQTSYGLPPCVAHHSAVGQLPPNLPTQSTVTSSLPHSLLPSPNAHPTLQWISWVIISSPTLCTSKSTCSATSNSINSDILSTTAFFPNTFHVPLHCKLQVSCSLVKGTLREYHLTASSSSNSINSGNPPCLLSLLSLPTPATSPPSSFFTAPSLPLLPAQLLRLARPDKKPDHQALAGQCLNDDLLELIMITEIYMLFHFICREAVTMKLGNDNVCRQ